MILEMKLSCAMARVEGVTGYQTEASAMQCADRTNQIIAMLKYGTGSPAVFSLTRVCLPC